MNGLIQRELASPVEIRPVESDSVPAKSRQVNRRAEERVTVSSNALIRPVGAPASDATQISIEDISSRGIGIKSLRELKPGYCYVIALPPEIRSGSEVIYHLKWTWRGEKYWHCGLSMLSDEERARTAFGASEVRRRKDMIISMLACVMAVAQLLLILTWG